MSQVTPNAKAKSFDFRTFDDKKDRRRKGLVGKLSGTLGDVEDTLRERNANGAGVFVVINEGGQTDADIARVRAVFADTDGAPLEPIVEAFAPHFVIESSPGKYHVYWRVDDDFPLDRFTPIQKAIAKKFGTDPAVCNLSRVMRLPGFAHNKGDPFDVHFVEEYLNPQLPRYSAEEIVDGLGLHEVEQPGPRSAPNVGADPPLSQASGGSSRSLQEAEEMLRYIDPWTDRPRWIRIILAIANEYGDAGRELAVRWSRGDLWSGSRLLRRNL